MFHCGNLPQTHLDSFSRRGHVYETSTCHGLSNHCLFWKEMQKVASLSGSSVKQDHSLTVQFGSLRISKAADGLKSGFRKRHACRRHACGSNTGTARKFSHESELHPCLAFKKDAASRQPKLFRLYNAPESNQTWEACNPNWRKGVSSRPIRFYQWAGGEPNQYRKQKAWALQKNKNKVQWTVCGWDQEPAYVVWSKYQISAGNPYFGRLMKCILYLLAIAPILNENGSHQKLNLAHGFMIFMFFTSPFHW